MSTQTQTRQALDLKVAEISQNAQLIVPQELVIDMGDSDARATVDSYKAQIDMSDTNSILFFGAAAQREVTTVSEQMLEGVRGKDVGPAGDALSNMVSTMRSLNLGLIDPSKKPNWFQRVFGGAQHGLTAFQGKFQTVTNQIEGITQELEQHKTTMLIDIEKLDRLYEANLDYFHDLELWIAAGEEKLKELDETDIPALEAKAGESGEMLDAQALRDLRQARDDLERRVHDLRLTRQVTMQSLPSIRLLQENDKSLVNKINSTIVNTVPLWQTQLAQSLAIFNTQRAGQAVKAANDLTNELLESNAQNLREANKTVREQIERGVVDMATLQKANEELIGTINDGLQIADEAKQRRATAEQQLIGMEESLKVALKSATALSQSHKEPEAAS